MTYDENGLNAGGIEGGHNARQEREWSTAKEGDESEGYVREDWRDAQDDEDESGGTKATYMEEEEMEEEEGEEGEEAR